MKSKNLYLVLMVFTALFLFTAQSADAMNEVSAQNAYNALIANTSAVMLDTRSVDEYYGCQPPWGGNACPNPEVANRGTAKWQVGGTPPTRLPFNLPYFIDTNTGGTGGPDDPAETTDILEALLAAGQIDFNSDIYLICRQGWRSHYMGLWMEANTFYNARTGVTATFTNLNDVDADGDPNTANGGMIEWTGAGLPVWLNDGDKVMPPQVISTSPEDGGVTSSAGANFVVTVLEPSAGGAGAITGYATVTQVCVDAGTPTCNNTDTNTVVNNYTIPAALAGGCDSSFTWISYASNTLTNYSPNAYGSGADDTRTITIGPIPSVIINSTLPSVSVALDAGVCAGTSAGWYVTAPAAGNPFELDFRYSLTAPYPGWVSGLAATYSGPLFDLPPYNVLNMSLPSGAYTFCFDVDTGTVYSDCEIVNVP